MAGTSLPLAGYAQFVEPHHLTVTHLELRIPNLPGAFDGFRIAQLSDFHYGPYTGKDVISAAVDLANSLKPDVVALTGDFITAPDRPISLSHRVFTEMVLCGSLLGGLKAPFGVFACLGNHDTSFNGTYVTQVLTSFGIAVLQNSNRSIQRGRDRLWIAGLDDHLCGDPSFSLTLAGVPARDTVVLLVHEPDVADETAKYPIAVQLSGHSHGGQVRLPLLDRLVLPAQARKYPFGYYRIGSVQLYTNRGIGTIVLPYRFNAPPEVTVVTLRTA